MEGRYWWQLSTLTFPPSQSLPSLSIFFFCMLLFLSRLHSQFHVVVFISRSVQCVCLESPVTQRGWRALAMLNLMMWTPSWEPSVSMRRWEDGTRTWFYIFACSTPEVEQRYNSMTFLVDLHNKIFYRNVHRGITKYLSPLCSNQQNLGNRRIRVDIADQSNDKGKFLTFLAVRANRSISFILHSW